MTNIVYEQALEIVRALSPEEQQQLFKQIGVERRQQTQPLNGGTHTRHQREREMRWLAAHEAEYAGQWLALDGDRLLSHGADPHQVCAAAKAQGVASPFVAFAEDPDEFFSGAWLSGIVSQPARPAGEL